MSNLFFPDLNLAYDFVKKPYFNTRIVTSINGREVRACLQLQPKFEMQLNYPVLSQRGLETEFKTLYDFFIARRGSFDSFLLKMFDDNQAEITIQGNESDTYFLNHDGSQLANVEPIPSTPVEDVTPPMWGADSGSPMWTSDSALMWSTPIPASYTVDSNGVVKFSRPIDESISVTINVTYYYRCRFSEDSQQFTLFTEKLWKGEVNLVSSLGNHI